MNTSAPRPPHRCLLAALLLSLVMATFTVRAQTPGSAWATERQPELAAFRTWALGYAKAHPADGGTFTPDAATLAQGVRLAQVRRPLLAALAQTDPGRAMASSLPANVRAALPAAVQAWVETPFATTGSLTVDAASGQRSVTLDGRTYAAHVYNQG